MRKKTRDHHTIKYLKGAFFIFFSTIAVFLFNIHSIAIALRASVAKIAYLFSEEFYTGSTFVATVLFASFCLMVILTIALIHSKGKNKGLLKSHKELLKRQQQELALIKERLAASEAQLRVQDVAKEKFISIMAKDLKNPLLALKSYSYTLKSKDGNFTPWELSDYASSLEKSLNHLIGLLNNVSRWSMVQNSLSPSQVDNININKMIAYTLRLMKPAADKKGIALLKNINCKVEVMGDAHMIEFILRNLVSNAIKFSNEGSVVMVKLRTEEENLVISVKDQGIGMDEEMISSIFHINETACANDSGSNAQPKLGLVLCKEFLQKLGGSIYIKSKPNEGSLFTISLPKNIHQRQKWVQ